MSTAHADRPSTPPSTSNGGTRRRSRSRSRSRSRAQARTQSRGGRCCNASSAAVFAPTDLDSGDGFMTTVWGPNLWLMLHIISMNYPVSPTAEHRRQYRAFFDSLQHVLPCGACRTNLTGNYGCTGYTDAVFESRHALSKWVYDLHACVNRMLGKQSDVTYEEMLQTFENFRARCGVAKPTRPTRRRQRRSPSSPPTPHSGCTDPISGIKSRCKITIVPQCDGDEESLCIDNRCRCVRRN